MSAPQMLFALLIGHALCDYPLQGDFLARAKNHTAPLPGVPWYQALVAHALIQAGMVWAVTQSTQLGVCELVAHLIIDYGKSAGWYDFNGDQTLHATCKVVWVWILLG